MSADGQFAVPAGTVSLLIGVSGAREPQPEAGPLAGAGPVAGAGAEQASALGHVLADAATRHGGVLCTGDQFGTGRFGAGFARASDAAACALAVQRNLADGQVGPRIAVHTGAAGALDRASHTGSALERCGLLAALAWPGQVLLSAASASLVAGRLSAGATLAGLGWHRLADLGPAEQVWQLCHQDLPAAFPPLRSLETYPHNLPVQLTSFVRQNAELAEVAALMDGARLVTLTGSGGCGKTRLALHAAAGRVREHPDGVWLAELAAVRDPAQVPASIAEALPLRQRGPVSEPAELAALIGAAELLIVLDNCEHLVRRCAELTEYLLRACPRLRMLATSREPLSVPGEVTWRVPSLSFPAEPARVLAQDPGRFEAVQLFAERARRARPRFALNGENAAAVVEICARLDGIPLAIELAAARARVLSAVQIADGLTDRFRLLAAGPRAAVPRQQTLEASVGWSHHLLSEPERAMLRQLSVFSGGFTLDAAAAVATGGDDAGPVLSLVSQLADKSLIMPADDGADGRFRMLETIRDYAAGRLAEAGQTGQAEARHFRFFAAAASRRPGEDEGAYCQRLRADYGNIRAALGWAARQDDPELLLGLTTRLVVFWSASTHLGEAVQWLRTAAERGAAADPALRARALGSLTQIASLALDLPTALAAGTEGLGLLRELGDREGTVMALTSLGSSATLMGEPEAGQPYLNEAIALAEEIGDQRALAYALALLGRTAVNRPSGRPAARRALRRGIEVARQCGARHVEGIALGVLGVLSALDCNPAEALPLLAESLPMLREAGDVFFLSLTLIARAQSLSYRGEFEAADSTCQELESIAGQLGAAQLYFGPCARGFSGFCRGDWPGAIRSFRELLTFFTPVGLLGTWVAFLAWTEFIEHQPETARQRLDEFIAATDPARTPLAHPLAVRALIAREDGDHERAASLARDALALAPEDPFGRFTVYICLAVFAAVQADQGSHELAVRLAAATTAFADAIAMHQPPAVARLTSTVLAACREALGASRFDQAWSQARGMTLAEAVAYASRGHGRRARPSQGWESLTPTELAVTGAVADGLTNPQIAARMFISRRTVTTHLTSIFHKLAISSRTELAGLAARHGDRDAPRVTPRS